MELADYLNVMLLMQNGDLQAPYQMESDPELEELLKDRESDQLLKEFQQELTEMGRSLTDDYAEDGSEDNTTPISKEDLMQNAKEMGLISEDYQGLDLLNMDLTDQNEGSDVEEQEEDIEDLLDVIEEDPSIEASDKSNIRTSLQRMYNFTPVDDNVQEKHSVEHAADNITTNGREFKIEHSATTPNDDVPPLVQKPRRPLAP